MSQARKRTDEVMTALEPFLQKDDEFRGLLEMNAIPELQSELQTMCQTALASLNTFIACGPKNTLGETTDYLQLIIATRLFDQATDIAATNRWNIPKEAMLTFAGQLGLIEALEYQANIYLLQLEKQIEVLAQNDFTSTPYQAAENNIAALQIKLANINQQLPSHWKAGYVFAALHQALEADLMLQKIDILQKNANHEDAKFETDKTLFKIQDLRKNALKNLTCAKSLKSLESELKYVNNLSDERLFSKFEKNAALAKYASSSTDPINIIANKLRFNLGTQAREPTEKANEEIKQIMFSNGILPSKAPLKAAIDNHNAKKFSQQSTLSNSIFSPSILKEKK